MTSKHEKRGEETTTEKVVEETTTEEQVVEDPSPTQEEEPQVGRRPGEDFKEADQAEEPGDSDSGAADDDSSTSS